jgi:hypothetical protein
MNLLDLSQLRGKRRLARAVLKAFCTTKQTKLHLIEEDAAQQNASIAISGRLNITSCVLES